MVEDEEGFSAESKEEILRIIEKQKRREAEKEKEDEETGPTT